MPPTCASVRLWLQPAWRHHVDSEISVLSQSLTRQEQMNHHRGEPANDEDDGKTSQNANPRCRGSCRIFNDASAKASRVQASQNMLTTKPSSETQARCRFVSAAASAATKKLLGTRNSSVVLM